MNIKNINKPSTLLIEQLLSIWEKSVKATHKFLSDTEIEKIKEYVPEGLRNVSHLIIITDDEDSPIAFMGIENKLIEMLFVSPDQRGHGLGTMLINYGIENYAINKVNVNEQNPIAKGFYEHLGFKVYRRSETDEQGNPYPILYMKK
ncbi:acetyltransferase [Companilactobacillus crustorum]|uniref:Acetyltransferase n=3 Tax=Companilactobacillus TaxID=2767879 RepID=A0A837RFC9_9LACO|nr:GNAT family N-acetyltransferase [Companilactobacillus crustorum]KRK41575.1 acetyltransferase [Companilactobacillus crustorum JCM 15951]KRO19229.1 acetyltransferase [Companilactobacillus crustorum]GEO77222.1 acetyltransferase [Companilactobacillus crustorum]HCD06981.1 GNAT family N-acetyltransferase [Lactobacillus sp.]